MKKICFIASTGGHFDQLMMLKPIMDKYDSFIITEKTSYQAIKDNRKIYYLKQVNRHEKIFILKMLVNIINTLKNIFKGKARCSYINRGSSYYTNLHNSEDI